MRSFLLNFLIALALFGGLFWYLYSQNQRQITEMAAHYGITAPSAPTPPPAAPTIDTGISTSTK